MKIGSALALPTILARKAKANVVEYGKGRLEIYNDVGDFNYDVGLQTTYHYTKGSDGYDNYYDVPYSEPPFWMNPVTTKIVSIIPDYQLRVDTRYLDSFTSVNVELSLHSQYNTPITVSNLQNWLICKSPPAGSEIRDFLPKPVTLWRRFLAEPNKFQFLADIREALNKNGGWGTGEASIPLPALNGTYESQVPYDFLQLRFDVYPGDFSLDGKVDMKDLAIIGNDWGKQGQPLEFVGDITGPQGLPDGKVDYQDLELLTRYWLKDIRDIMPSP